MIKNKKVLAVAFGIGALLCMNPLQTRADFPSNMDEKHLITYSINSQLIDVYGNESMTEKINSVSGDGLVLEASDVSDDQNCLYGVYKNEQTGETGEGWIPANSFLYTDAFQHVYATVRSKMTVYTSSSLSVSRANIKKYSGIIAVGKKGDAVQVIYEKDNNYGIGWLPVDDYDNKLVYDGRDKQTLANGTYYFRTGTTEIDPLSEATGKTLTLTYVEKDKYHLYDVEDNQYLTMNKVESQAAEVPEDLEEPEWLEKGLTHFFKSIFSKSYRKKVKQWEADQAERKLEQEEIAKEQEEISQKVADGKVYQDETNGVIYSLGQTETEQDAGLFKLERLGNTFKITSDEGEVCVGDNQEDEYILMKADQVQDDFAWKVRAVQPLVDVKQPLVLTQYDPQWCGTAYGEEGCIGTAGCGLLATMNAVYSLTGQYMSLLELRDYAVEQGYRIEGNGTDEGIFKAAAVTYGEKYGFTWDGSSGKIGTLKKKLQSGDVAVAHVIGHYVAIVSYNPETNKFLLLDSNCLPKRETSAFGDWVSQSRLEDGYLYGQNYYFFKMGN